LLRGDGFDHVFHAESVGDKYFKIFFSRNACKNARLGIIASKKILPGAADRNRAKRLIREAFRRHNSKICKVDMVVMVKRTHLQGGVVRGDNLEALFSQVENRCAEL
jgi:ribonuclease P protein component